MWRVLALQPFETDACWFANKDKNVLGDWGLEKNADEEDTYNEDSTQKIGERCCKWITEAHLAANSMPAKSFSLVLNGDPAPHQSAELFEIVKEDAAWQVALSQWYLEKSLDLTFQEVRRGGIFYSEVFPQAIQDIVDGKSFVRCKSYVADFAPLLQIGFEHRDTDIPRTSRHKPLRASRHA